MTRCPAVRYGTPTVPFVIALPVRCSRDAGHPPDARGDVWHSGSGVDLDGEVFGCAWRELPALTTGVRRLPRPPRIPAPVPRPVPFRETPTGNTVVRPAREEYL